jgi:virulence-associated protein VagC
MTKRVTRKLFKNGGSWAVRIPKDFLPENPEIDVVMREDGVIEIRPLDRQQRLQAFLARMMERGELPDSEIWLPDRKPEPERWDWDELAGDKQK